MRPLATGSREEWQAPETNFLPPAVAFQTRCQSSGAGALAADVHQLDRPVGNDDSEGRADGAFNQVYFAVMGAHQFGGDRKAEPAAAGAA